MKSVRRACDGAVAGGATVWRRGEPLQQRPSTCAELLLTFSLTRALLARDLLRPCAAAGAELHVQAAPAPATPPLVQVLGLGGVHLVIELHIANLIARGLPAQAGLGGDSGTSVWWEPGSQQHLMMRLACPSAARSRSPPAAGTAGQSHLA